MPKLRSFIHRTDISPPPKNGSQGTLICSESVETTETLVDGATGLDVPSSLSELPLRYKARDDLWQEAVRRARLTIPSEQGIVESDRASTLQVIYEEATKRQGEKSHKTIRRSNGRNVSYREIYGKIITWVKKLQMIGDIAVQADAGYASLPWENTKRTVPCLRGMELVSNLIYHYAVIEEVYLGKHSQIVIQVQNSIISLYIAILQYLIQALKYFGWSKAKRVFNGLSPTANDDIKQKLTAIENAKKNVDADASHANHELSIDRMDFIIEGQKELEQQIARAGIDQERRDEYLEELVREWQAPLNVITDRISEVHDYVEEAQIKKISDWLSTIQQDSYHSTIQANRLQSSGKWLLASLAFRRWIRCEESSLLWMYGILGSGKTNLASMLIDHLRPQHVNETETRRFAFFYCSRNEAGSDNLKDEASRAEPVEALRNIVKQLCGVPGRADIELSVKEKYQQLKPDVGEPRKLSIPECIGLIIALSKDTPSTIVIDALDECRSSTRIDLIKGLNEIINSSSEHVKVFLTTRRLSPIARQLEMHPSIEVTSDKNGDDIRHFVSTQLHHRIQNRELLDGDVSENLKADIEKSLVQRADGMFWYASLQLSLLCDPERMWDEETVRETLAVLPTTLEELYVKIIDDINREDLVRNRVTAQKTLKWLLCARAPLSCSAFLEAISSQVGGKHFRPSTEFVINACKTLVVIDEENNVFQFAHLSVREYLEKRAEYSEGECHFALAESCLHVVDMSFGSTLMDQEISDAKAEFSRYATMYWPVHYQHINFEKMDEGKETIRETLKDLLIQGQDTTPAFKRWLSQVQESVSSLDLDTSDNKPLMLKLQSLQAIPETSLFTACVFGFPDVIEQFGRNRLFNFDLCKVQQQNALCLAVENNQLETVKALLYDRRTDVNKLNVLAVTVYKSLKDNVRQSGLGMLPEIKVYATALQAAAVQGSLAMVTYLVEEGANVGLVAGYFGSPLQAAALHGHEALVSFFLGRCRGEPNSQGGFHGNALQAAAAGGNVSIIALLLSKGASVATPGGHYGSALMAATYSGNIDAVKALLNAGADINEKSKLDGTPVQRAADMDNEDLLQLLIKKGADINADDMHNGQKSPDGSRSALAAAAWGGHKKIVSILLRNGARTDLRSREPRLHILHQAVIHGMYDLAEYCLHSGKCHVDMPTNSGADKQRYDKQTRMTPLSFACAEGHVDLVRLLLSHGALLDHAEEDLSLLQLAASRGFARIVSLLLDECSMRQNDAEAQQYIDRRRGGTGITALGLAARSGSVEAVAVLLDRNAAWIPTRSGVTPLHNAAWGNRLQVVDLILKTATINHINGDFSIDTRNSWGKTPLIDAIDRNNIMVSILLLDHGADYAACDSTNKSTLHYAVIRNQPGIVRRLLLAYDKNPKSGYLEIRNADKNTALNEAFGRKYWEIARLLLAHGAKWIPSDGRESLLHVAVEKNLDLARQYLAIFAEYPEQLRNFINSRTSDGKTPLHVAAALNLCEAAKLLLDHRADFAALNHAFRTPLHWAIHKDHVALARILLDAALAFPEKFGAFINQPSDLSTPALHEAVIRRHYDSIALLLEYGADVSQSCQNSDNESVLHKAIIDTNLSHRTTNSDAILKLLLEHALESGKLHPMIDFRTSKFGNTALSEACQSKRLDAATILLRFGADFNLENKEGATPLHVASWRGDLEMVQILFRFACPDPEEKSDRFSKFANKRNNAGYTALCKAAEQGYTEVAATLLRDFRADYTLKKSTNSCTALHLSAYRGHFEVVEVLLFQTSQDPDKARFRSFINHHNVYGATAIIDAVEKDHLGVTKLLLEQYNADYALADNRGCTTLHIAASKDFQDEVQLLLSHASGSNNRSENPSFKAYLNAQNKYGKTALMDAMDFNRPSIVKVLYGGYRADFTLTDNAGATALHYGTRKNNTSCVESLLHSISRDPSFNSTDHPSPPFAIPLDFLNHANNAHETAVMIACERGNADIVDILLNGHNTSYEIPKGNEGGGTLLHVAMGRAMARDYNRQILRIVLAHVKSRIEDGVAFREWVERRDAKGRRVEAMAMSRGDQEALFILMNALAR